MKRIYFSLISYACISPEFRFIMEVIDTCDALPSNAEVLQFLQENRTKLAGGKKFGQAKAGTVVLETLHYLGIVL